jgi:peptidoglycan hydrolase-like protein with peptidoglycan-binding domain
VLTKAQRQLWSLGYYKGDIDGTFGPVTQKAIEIFQRENGLPITGHLDSRTLQQLNIRV